MSLDVTSMIKALKTLRAVQWSMLASILLYGIVGEVVGPAARGVDPTLSYLFSTLGVAIVGVIFVVRRTLVLRAAESLATSPRGQPQSQPLENGLHSDLRLCEALALFGLVLRFLGCTCSRACSITWAASFCCSSSGRGNHGQRLS